MKKPNFFIVGHAKSATTALWFYLKQHPEVFMSEPKEPHYFSGLSATESRTLESYMELFKGCKDEKVIGEASPENLYISGCAQKIHDFNPEAKIIVIFREPVEFLYSFYLQFSKKSPTWHEEAESFEEALALEPARKEGRELPSNCTMPKLFFYSEWIKYTSQLKAYYKYFDKNKVKVIIYDDFKKDNVKIYKEILEFLEVDTSFQPVFEIANPTFKIPHFVIFLGKPFKLIPSNTRKKLIRLFYKIFAKKKSLNPALVNKLKKRFRGEVKELGEFIGRDLMKLWEYLS